MNDTSHPRLQIADLGEKVLGSNLLGFQVGNEPDLYLPYVSPTPLGVVSFGLLISVDTNTG